MPTYKGQEVSEDQVEQARQVRDAVLGAGFSEQAANRAAGKFLEGEIDSQKQQSNDQNTQQSDG